jgi:hypothetical protein
MELSRDRPEGTVSKRELLVAIHWVVMDAQDSGRVVTGLSVEKFTVYQLKKLQPQLKALATGDGTGGLAFANSERVNDALAGVTKILYDSRVRSQLAAVAQSPELLVDLLTALAVYNVMEFNSTDGEDRDSLQAKVDHISRQFFQLTVEAASTAAAASVDPDLQDSNIANPTVAFEGVSSLNVFTSLGALGIEKIAAIVLDGVYKACRDKLDRNNDEITHQTTAARLQRLLRFANSFLAFTQLVMEFHSNRRKLYSTLCESLLPSLLRLLSLCDACCTSVARGDNGSGTNALDLHLTAEDRLPVAKYLAPLRDQLRGVLEKGLFDGRTVEELASLRLAESVAVSTAAAGAGAGGKSDKPRNKKVKSDNGQVLARSTEAAEEGEKSLTAGAAGKNNKAFHDLLFRSVAAPYYAESNTNGAGEEPARGVAALAQVYFERSAALAAQASAAGQRQSAGYHGTHRGRGQVATLSMDAVNARKHLVRVFHFTFLLLEALRRDGDRAGLLRALAAASDPPVAGGKRKTHHNEHQAQLQEHLLFCRVRGALLTSCVQALSQQAIPNHESLQRYVQRLDALSAECVQDCLATERALVGLGADVTELLALDMQCVRDIAAIDHNTVVEHRLANVVRLLCCPAAGARTLYVSGKALLQKVLEVHGELRLLDQFVLEAGAAEAAVGTGQDMLLSELLNSEEVAAQVERLLTAVPTGQGVQIWAHLSQKQDNTAVAHVGPAVCALARALVKAQVHTVRSNAQVFSEDGKTGGEVTVDPVLGHAANLLWGLTETLKALVTQRAQQGASKKSSHKPDGQRYLNEVMTTVTALLRFVVHYSSGGAEQLTLPAVDTPSAKLSLVHIALNPLLNTLIAVQRDSAVWTATLSTTLALLLLATNMASKVSTAEAQYSAQLALTRTFAVQILSAPLPNSGDNELALETMACLLRVVRTWSQLAAGDGGLLSQHLLPLCSSYLAAALDTRSQERSAVTLVRGLLHNASVVDCEVVTGAMRSAVKAAWEQKLRSKGTVVDDRATFVCCLCDAVPRALLRSADSIMPGLLQHALGVCRAQAEGAGATSAGVVLKSADQAASVLLGYVRASQYSRFGGAAAVDAEDKALCVLDRLVRCVGTGVSVREQGVVGAVEVVLPALLQMLNGVAGLCGAGSEGAQQLVTFAQLYLDTVLSHLLEQLTGSGAQRASDLFEQLWITMASVVTAASYSQLQANEQGRTAVVASLFRTALNTCLGRISAGGAEHAAVTAALKQLVTGLLAPQPSTAVALLAPRSAKKAARTPAKVPAVRVPEPGPVSGPSGARYHFLADAVEALTALHRGGPQPSQAGAELPALEDTQVTSLVRELVAAAGGVADAEAGGERATTSEGWLRLFGVVCGPVLLQLGVVTLPQSDSSEAVVLSAQTAVLQLPRLRAVCQLQYAILRGVSNRSDEPAVVSTASTAVTSLTVSVLQYVLLCRACNCEVTEVLALVREEILSPLCAAAGSSVTSLGVALARDMLTYFTEHGRRLFSSASAGAGKFHTFHQELTVAVSLLFQEYVASLQGTGADGVDRVTIALQQANAVTAAASASLQRQARANGRRKKQQQGQHGHGQRGRRGQDGRETVFRFDLWCDGLVRLLALSMSHMQVWSAESSHGDVSGGAREANTATVRLVKSALVNLERVVSVSAKSGLPNLNTAVGVICSLLTASIALLLSLEGQLASAGAGALAVKEAQEDLASCYHLLCRLCGVVGTSAALEKHIHFIASAVVEALSKSTVTRQFQELAYPGVYALFERCQSRQKTQMFAMLDPQSRVLMTDLHNEFMRSFKFVGK